MAKKIEKQVKKTVNPGIKKLKLLVTIVPRSRTLLFIDVIESTK